MTSELVIYRTLRGQYNVTDSADSTFELSDITDVQLLGYLKNRKLVGTTAEAVLRQLDSNKNRSVVHVVIDRSL